MFYTVNSGFLLLKTAKNEIFKTLVWRSLYKVN